MCKDDFELAATSGRCGSRLWSVARVFSEFCHLDVEENEGYNSLVRTLALLVALCTRRSHRSDRFDRCERFPEPCVEVAVAICV